jgi:hypothetical protein
MASSAQGGPEVTTSCVPTTREVGGFRWLCTFFSVCTIAALSATVAQAGSGRPAVDVAVLDDTPSHVVLDYSFGDFTKTVVSINGADYTQIALGKESQLLQAGAPDLPNVCRSIIIPADAAVDARVVAAESYVIENVDIAPSKGNLYRHVDPDTVPYAFGEVYRVNADYPGELAVLSEPYILRDHRGVVVRVNPFQYNPVARTLRVYTDMTVEVVATGPGAVNILQPSAQERELSLAFHQLYEHHFLNYRSDLRYDPIDETGSMLVICYDAWMPNVEPLVDHKNSIGIDTTMVGVSEIGNSAISIKNYIQDVYDAGHLTFVLLVGDASQVATPYASGGSADPTYALLAGSDHYPDIFVGRFSAETAAQVDTQVERTIEYEVMPATVQDWFWRGIGIGSDEGAGQGDDGESDHQHIENIRTDLLNFGYTLVDGFYGYSATATQVANAVNDGRGIINYCGHGSTYSWGTSGFSSANVNALVNDNMLPFIVSVACVNGQFAGYTCFAEAWLRATNGTEPTGAIGMYASSIDQSWAPPMCAQDETVDLLCAEAYFSFGALCFAGSCQMMDEYGSAGIQMFDTWHVFGDPSVRVSGIAEPPTGIWVRGDDLHASGQKGGPFTPDSVVYQLENKNETPVDYEVTASVTWVDISNASGALPGRGTIDVTVALNEEANALGHGLHEGTIYFTNLTDHDGDTTRPVSIDVDDMHLRYSFPLDSGPSWATEGQWAFGQPTGGGSHNRDPLGGHTGNNAYGYNLNGDYTNNMPAYYLTTSAIDCSAFSFVELRFWRWLGVESSAFDHATVEVSSDGTYWTQVWANPASAVSDSSWTQMVLDISAVADGEPTVYVRWKMGSTDNSVTYPGWNIDDVEIWGAGDIEPIPGDLDGDGDVDLEDLATLLAHYGTPSGATYEDGDLDGDGDVDLVDLSGLLANYGHSG